MLIMRRRDFLRITGAAAAFAQRLPASESGGAATVLYDDRVVTLDRVMPDPGRSGDVLWVRKMDLPRINAFELKPQGACRADVCIPIPKTMLNGEWFHLTAFAKKAGQAVVADEDARVWSLGEIQALRGSFLSSREAPDVAIPDRRGRPVKLSSFRGKKVLLVTWASW